MKKMKGKLIIFEGPEGGGKSTQIQNARDYFESLGHRVCITRQPGGTDLGQKVRGMLLDPAYEGMAAEAELFLYFADRAENIKKVVLPALERGEIVLSDRFSYSTIAYQGYGRGIDLSMIYGMDEIARCGVWPDLTLILDVDPTEGLKRAGQHKGLDRLEQESFAFHQRVRAGYLFLAYHDTHWKRNAVVISADGAKDVVWAAVKRVLDDQFAVSVHGN